MEQKSRPFVAGLGGAGILAAVLSVGGHLPQTTSDEQSADRATADKSSLTSVELTANQEGPWYAFCREYATTEFDHGEDPSQERGISGHHVPIEADEGTVEITREIPFAGPSGREIEKFDVKKHTVGDLAGCVPVGNKLRVVIATVPDPNATQMPIEFDRDIQAIQEAAAAQRYNYTRFWFPWRGSDWVADKSADPEAEVRRREEPGILCFRKNATTERLFVLLVGETPTSGVNRLQFAHALYYRDQLRTQIVDEDKDRLKISGPHFSSSFPAIQDVLDRAVFRAGEKWPPPGSSALPQIPFVDIVSPDASGSAFIDSFRSFCDIKSQPRCALENLSLTSKDIQATAIQYLEGLGYPAQRIAELGEDGSAFAGQEFFSGNPGGSSSETSGDDGASAPQISNRIQDYGLKLRFPRDLSSLRALSDRESGDLAKSGSKYLSLPNGLLPTQLTAKEPIDRDSPPALATEQEAAQASRSLADAVEALHSHGIRAVVISASNPLDRIYLLEYLRQHLPDVRSVTVDVDALELDSPQFQDLTGTIGISALPSIAGVSSVSGNIQTPPMSFKSSRQLGEFLGIEMLLEQKRSGNAIRANSASCYSVSVVGENGFRLLPLETHGSTEAMAQRPCPLVDETGRVSGEPIHSRSGSGSFPSTYMVAPPYNRSPGFLRAFLWMVIVLSGLHFFSLAQSRRDVEGALSYPHQLAVDLEMRRVYLLTVLNNQLLLLNLLSVRVCLAVIRFHPLSPMGWWLPPTLALLAVFTLLTLVLLVYFMWQFVRQARIAKGVARDWGGTIANMAFSLAFLIWTACMILCLPALHRNTGIFVERVTHLNEGLSPVMPITAILLGYALWSWMQLKRLDWSASRRIELCLLPTMNQYLHKRIEEVMEDTEALMPHEQTTQLVIVAMVIASSFFLWKSLNGFDGKGFHFWIVVWGFATLLLTVMLACFQAKSIWTKLKKLLDWLETTVMRDVFEEIGKSGLLSVKIWDLAKQERSFTVLSQTVEKINVLYGANSVQALCANGELSVFVKADAVGRQVDAGEIDTLNDALNVAVSEAVKAIDQTGETANLPGNQNELRLYLALRFVALIRYTMLQVGTLIGFVAYGYVLAVLSIMFYAFEGRKTLGELLALTFVILLIWIGMMMVQFQRNGMLSRLAGGTPGEASYLEVGMHLLTVGGLPLLAIVTSQFPSVANLFFSIFRPVLETLH